MFGENWKNFGQITLTGQRLYFNATASRSAVTVIECGTGHPNRGAPLTFDLPLRFKVGGMKFSNTVVFNNGADAAGEYGTANLTNYINCASGFANADGVNCKVIDETAFTDWANRNENVANLKPAMGLDNPLANAGGRLADYTGFGAISMTDLLGAPRFCGAKVDLGCIEGDAKPGMLLLLR